MVASSTGRPAVAIPVWLSQNQLIMVQCWLMLLGAAAFIGRARIVGLRDLGGCQAPFNSFLNIIGLETLALRAAPPDSPCRIRSWRRRSATPPRTAGASASRPRWTTVSRTRRS